MNNNINFYFEKVKKNFEKKNFTQAKKILLKILKLQPNNFDALHNMGIILSINNQNLLAIDYLKKARLINPNNNSVIYNLANAWNNIGIELRNNHQYNDSLIHFDEAIQTKSDYVEAFNNKGNLLIELQRYDEALTYFDKAIQIKPDFFEALNNKAITLKILQRYDEALFCYEKIIKINSNFNEVLGNYIYLKSLICDWTNFYSDVENLKKKILLGVDNTTPLISTIFFDTEKICSSVAKKYSKIHFPRNFFLTDFFKNSEKNKIKLGYYSYDFRNHAVATLIAELFEIHNREIFEIVGFSFCKPTKDLMQQRLQKSFDQFIDVSNHSDIEIAKLSRELKIDIAVDLNGHTYGGRTNIFALRAAPIQVNYLGFPGTMGSDYYDYIIADKIVIPDQDKSFFSEKIIYLPHSYQVNDRKKEISSKNFSREELGLPLNDFIFCCFNNIHKIQPKTFAIWMEILNSVRNSALWLLGVNPIAANNLKKQMSLFGINPERLIFASHLPIPEHLSRHKCADLFLDTFPYNAHTTASDALWAGLPVLTMLGNSFAGRVTSSLLCAIELPELITNSEEEYKSLAVELATNKQKINLIKNKLMLKKQTAPLFNTPLFTKYIEQGYVRMFENYKKKIPIDDIRVESI